MSTRWILAFGLGLALVAGAAVLLLREDPETEPTAPIQRAANAASEEARLQGVGDADGADDYLDADVATTLSAFRFQPPNVVAGAVARLRQHVTADPALLEHLVRAALTLEDLRPEYVEPDFPYDGRSLAIWAVEGLGRTAVPLLVAHLEQESDAGRRRAILAFLRGMGGEAAPAVGVLRRHLGDTDLSDHERATTILTLSLVGPAAAEAEPELLRLLGDPDDPLFDGALQAIYRIAGMTDEVRDAFIDLLAIEDDDLRVEVLDMIVQQVGEDARALRPMLVHLVGHDQPDVRRLALQALEPVGVEDRDALLLVGRRHEEGESDEEFAAKHVLLASGDAGRETLLETFRTTDDVGLAVRTGQTLARAGAGERLPTATLLRMFRECDPNAVSSVVFLMGMVPGGVEASSVLPVIRAELLDADGDRRWAAAMALSAVRGDDDAVLDLAAEALQDERVADSAVAALGRMARLAPRVVPLLETQALAGRLAAVDALGRLARTAPLARAALDRLAASAEDPDLRADARQVLQEVDAARAGS